MSLEHKKLASEVAAGRMASGLRFGQWNQKETIALACEMLAAQNHSETLAGQITVRSEGNTFLTTPMAVGFDEVSPDDIIRVDANMDVIEGIGMANPAMRFHVWIYRARPDVNCIIHTHPPFVSALAMTGRKLKVAHMDATPFARLVGFDLSPSASFLFLSFSLLFPLPVTASDDADRASGSLSGLAANDIRRASAESTS